MNRAPGIVWMLRYPTTSENGAVLTTEEDEILIQMWGSDWGHQEMFVSRASARLLAKRINQCLDGTAKK